jgi:hypothetical protein
MGAHAVIEWAPFQLAEGVDERTLLDASRALEQDFLAKQKGYLGRELLRQDARHWVDLVRWASRAHAEAAMANVAASPACHAYFKLMAGADTMEPGAGVLHLDRIEQYRV